MDNYQAVYSKAYRKANKLLKEKYPAEFSKILKEIKEEMGIERVSTETKEGLFSGSIQFSATRDLRLRHLDRFKILYEKEKGRGSTRYAYAEALKSLRFEFSAEYKKIVNGYKERLSKLQNEMDAS